MRTRSHDYLLTPRDWARALLPTLFALACATGLLKVGARLRIFPPPDSASDPTTAVLAHQIRAARAHSPAKIVLLGDSTCMMDVDAPGLSRQMSDQPPVINLGLMVWLGFDVYAEALSDFVNANPGQVSAVVLLVTPRKLGLIRDAKAEEVWRRIRGQGAQAFSFGSGRLTDWLGIPVLRQNLLTHLLATPLRGTGRGTAYFGFSSEVDRYMTAHQGSLLEFGAVARQERPRRPNLVLATGLEAESRCFRAKVPRGAKLFVGLTPMGDSQRSSAELRQYDELLRKWASWIGADRTLTNLPATLPDVFFSSGGHLNELGQRRFTRLLAAQLTPLLKQSSKGM